MDASHSFRLRLKTYFTQKGKDKNKAPVVNPTHGTIYVAKQFPKWQSIILNTMKAEYEDNKKKLPENSVIASKLSKVPDLKKYMKKVMPFAEHRKQMFAEFGESVFNETSAFSERDVLNENIAYLMSTLDLEGLDIEFSDAAEERIQDETCPGEPFIVFRVDPSVPLIAVNQQPTKPYFQIKVPIYSSDTVRKVIERICKDNKFIKDPSKVKLMRYKDPEAGPRRLPNIDTILDDKIEMKVKAKLSADLKTNDICVEDNGKKQSIGTQIVYFVDEN